MDVQFQCQSGPCRICGRKIGNGTAFSDRNFVLSGHLNFIIVPYSFIHLPPTLYDVFLPALQFSTVRIIPPLLQPSQTLHQPPRHYPAHSDSHRHNITSKLNGATQRTKTKCDKFAAGNWQSLQHQRDCCCV